MNLKNWALSCCLLSTLSFAGGCEQPANPIPEKSVVPPVVETTDGPTLEKSQANPPDDETTEIKPTDESAGFSPGIEIGKTIPDFALADQSGTERTLANLIGDDHQYVALVFFRSADW